MLDVLDVRVQPRYVVSLLCLCASCQTALLHLLREQSVWRTAKSETGVAIKTEENKGKGSLMHLASLAKPS